VGDVSCDIHIASDSAIVAHTRLTDEGAFAWLSVGWSVAIHFRSAEAIWKLRSALDELERRLTTTPAKS